MTDDNETEQEFEIPVESPVKLKLSLPVVLEVGTTPTLSTASFEFECSRHHFSRQLNTLMLMLGTLQGIIAPPLVVPH